MSGDDDDLSELRDSPPRASSVFLDPACDGRITTIMAIKRLLDACSRQMGIINCNHKTAVTQVVIR